MPPLSPWEPLDPPIDPLRPLNSSLGLIELLILTLPQLPFKSSEDPSNVAVDPKGYLTPPPWPLGALQAYLDPLGPCRPTHWAPGTLKAYPLTPWDLIGLPLDPLRPRRPTLWPPQGRSRGPLLPSLVLFVSNKKVSVLCFMCSLVWFSMSFSPGLVLCFICSPGQPLYF